ncbi:MAG TPA: glycosyltransferase family 39 protein [Terriglobales bacterium]|nr:glycosyltransferase family 39 protein [Terriglobales bacterium]
MSQTTKTADPATVQDSREPTRHPIELLILSALMLISAVLCLVFLAKKPFWFDEAFSVELARFNWHNFAGLVWKREGNMALYYLLLRGWAPFGHSPFFFRSLSVLPAVATVPVVYWLGRRLYDARTGLIAATLLTFNAWHIRYAQEARSYSLFVFLAALSSAFLIAYLLRPSPQTRAGHVLASSLAVYAHFYAGLLVIAQWLSLRFLDREQIPQATNRNWRWIVLLTAPAMIFVAKTGASPLHWIQRPGINDLYQFSEQITGNGGVLLVLAYVVACIAALLPITWTEWQVPRSAWRVRFLPIWLLFPVLFTLAVSIVRPLFLGRYFVFCLPALVLLAGAGLARVNRTWLLILALGVFLVLSLKGTMSYYDHDFDLTRDNWAGVSKYVLTNSHPGDALVFHAAMGRMPYQFFQSLARNSATAPAIVFPGKGGSLDFHELLAKPTPEDLRAIAVEYNRVWVVLMNHGTASYPDTTTRVLDEIFSRSFPEPERQNFFPATEVRLYSRNR